MAGAVGSALGIGRFGSKGPIARDRVARQAVDFMAFFAFFAASIAPFSFCLAAAVSF